MRVLRNRIHYGHGATQISIGPVHILLGEYSMSVGSYVAIEFWTRRRGYQWSIGYRNWGRPDPEDRMPF